MSVHIPLEDFIERVFVTHERVHFSYADPYGHLNSARYLELMLNHRVQGGDDLLHCYSMDIARELGLGFAVTDANLKFISACRVGDHIEIASWVNKLEGHDFTVDVVMSDERTRKVKATATFRFASVSVKTGARMKLPKELPSRAQENLMGTLQMKDDYLETLKKYPNRAPQPPAV